MAGALKDNLVGYWRMSGPTEPLTYIFPGGYTLTLDFPTNPVINRTGPPDYTEVMKSFNDPNYVKRNYTHTQIAEYLEFYLLLQSKYCEQIVLMYIRTMVLEVKFEANANNNIRRFNELVRAKFNDARGSTDLQRYRALIIDDAYYGESSKSSWSSSSSSHSSSKSSESSSSSSS